jgi:HEAT repeat protein
MLDGLDAIDWASLTHAYGEATDVPGLLRSLPSPEPGVRKRAIHELFGTIWHQGTVYPASAAAVPFLYELLTAPGVPGKSDIAYLLASIADGAGYLEVHALGDFGEPTWREILGGEGKTLEGELAREAAEVDSVRRACSAGLAHLAPFLGDGEPEVRRVVADALGNYPEHAALSLPALEAAEASEADEEVQAALRESKARLTRSAPDRSGSHS